MTYAPPALKAAQVYLKEQTGLPWVSLGLIGDEDHDGGYHCGWDRRDRDADGDLDDYSWEESPRDWGHKTDAASGLDVGEFVKGKKNLRDFSRWLVEQCKAGAPDTRDIREVIYSLDGETVLRWDRLGKRKTGDKSHTEHTHISYHRDAEARDKTGLFRRYFEGDDDMPTVEEFWNKDGSVAAPPYALKTDPKNTHWTAGNYLRSTRERVETLMAEIRAVRAGQAAILAAVKGDQDTAAIIAAIERTATADAERDAADAERDAALLAELREIASGGATAEEVIDVIAARITNPVA